MPHKILVADDNDKNRTLFQDILIIHGFEVSVASDGHEAVAQARQLMPDLILMDIQMPDMDGFQATQTILADDFTRDIPVIGVTAYASPTTRAQALRTGMAAIFEKPIDHKLFVAQIRALLPPGKIAG